LVGAAINSALAQQVEGLKVVVVDNHSDDGTWELVKAIRDPRLRVHRNSSNLGLFGNFNRVAEYASESYTLFLCSDDRLMPGFLASAIALMQASSGATVVSSRGRIVDMNGNQKELIGDRLSPGMYTGASVPPAWFWASYFLGQNIFNYPSGIVFRTAALKQCLPFDESLGSPADIDMILRVLQLGDLLISDEVGCLVTRHDGQEQNVFRRNADLIRQELTLFERYRPMLELVHAYDSLRSQVPTLMLSTLIRTARFNIRLAHGLYREFDRNPYEMFAAATRRIISRVRYSIRGSGAIRYIVKRPNIA
jgi:glycosyltransferase involved in cell wall biosynthesis